MFRKKKSPKNIQCVACNWVGTREETIKIRTHKLRIDRCDCPECGCSTFYENKKKSWLSIWK